MVFVLAIALLVALVFGPSLWARRVMRKHAKPRPDLPGTGGDLARHLLDRAGLDHVKVEATECGDHYDPKAKAVRLTPANLDGRSITAVAVAAHEVGHALQDKDGYKPLRLRTRLVPLAFWGERAAGVVLGLSPLAFALSPRLGLIQALAAFVVMGGRIVVHAITLPVERDASFGRALPILEEGGYLDSADLPAAKAVLRAAAYTYVAAALRALLDLTRWIRVWR